MTDVIARLRVNAADFSSEINSVFDQLSNAAKQNSAEFSGSYSQAIARLKGDAKREFGEVFRDLGRQTTEAVSRAGSGGPVFDATSAKAAAAASRERVAALEQFVTAAQRAVQADTSMAAQTRLLVQAGQAQLVQERQTADALEQKARALSLVTQQLNGTSVATQRTTQVSGQLRSGMQQLGFQVNDVGAQLASGTSATVIFAQQSSQFIQAVQLMTGETRGFLGWLGSPWGIALSSAITLLAAFWANHERSAKSTAENTAAQKSLTDRIREQNEELRKNVELQDDKLKRQSRDAIVNQGEALIRERKLQKDLAEQERLLQSFRGMAGEDAGTNILLTQQRIKSLRVELDAASDAADLARESVRRLEAAAIERRVSARTDPAEREKQRVEKERSALRALQAERKITNDDYARRLLQIEQRHKANTNAIEATARAEREAASGREKLKPVTSGEVRGLLEGIGATNLFGARTAKRNKAVGGSARSMHLIDQAYDLGLVDAQGKPMTKARIRAELESQGIIIKELLGPGDKDHNDHFHVAFSKKRASGERIADRAIRDAVTEQRELDQALGMVRGSLDESGKAAAVYADQLIKINELHAAGRIDDATAAEYRRAAALEEVAAQAKIAGTRLEQLARTAPDVAELLSDAGPLVDAKTVDRDIDKWVEKQKEASDKANERQREQIQGLADFYERAFSSGGKSIWSDFKSLGRAALSNLLAQWTIGLLSGNRQGLSGLGSGGGGGFDQILGGLTGAGSGGFGGSTGTFGFPGGLPDGAAGGAPTGGAGGPVGLAISLGALALGGSSKTAQNTLGAAALGFQVGGPIGAAAAAAVVLIGSALKKTKRASSTLGFANGGFSVASTRGNSASRRESSIAGIGSVGDALEQIRDALGAEVTGAGSVSFGIRKKTYVVDPTGRGRTKGAGVLRFASEEDAIRAAVSDVLSDGVLTGISEASRKILASGKKLEDAIEQAALIEAIPKALKSRLDPLGAAIDELNARWDKNIAALTEGGASVEQIADAQKLYALELAEVRENTKGASAALKDYLAQFRVGSSSPFSLRDQRANAEADLEVFYQAIRDGRSIDNDKFVEASNAANAVIREIEGGTAAYFDFLDRNRAFTETAIARIDSNTGSGANRDPFAELTARSAQQTANNTLAMADILGQTNDRLDLIANKLGSLGLDGGVFLGGLRSFA
jgi:hypothetical protein